MTSLILKNKNLLLEFNRRTGALIGMIALQTGWCIVDRPHLGLSFRLLVPLTNQRNNPVYGEKQVLSRLDVNESQTEVVFTWNTVHSEHGGELDICVQQKVCLENEQAVFSIHLDNRSPYPIENVYSPYLGGVCRPPDSQQFKAFIYDYAAAQEWSIYPHYVNKRGYFGVDYPTQFGISHTAGTPSVPYCLLMGDRQGVYAGVNTPGCELVAWHTELRPGYEYSIDERVPDEKIISGIDVDLRFAAVHVPFIQPGESRSLTPIALRAFRGGWQAGSDIYKGWRDSWMKTAELPHWVREPHSWLQLHINSPEDELRMPFKDLVKVGEECAYYGVKAIQLVGWNDGGQDRGNPSHDPDPRLGTFSELKEAIRQIQSLGVKVILFSKFTWADRSTQRYRQHLRKLAVKDPYGDEYVYGGYQYQTASQLLNINTRRLIPMCFLSKEYLQICEEEFQKTLDLGAEGILYDESQHHSPALLCFDETHGHRLGAPVYANDCELIRRFSRRSNPVNPEFLYAGEACYDWEFERYHLSYHRSWSKNHIPLMRYLQPHMPLMTAVTGFNDRSMINQCLLYRYIISYEPYNFKGKLSDFPLTMAYGRQMDALRTELREYFWDGEFRDTQGAAVTCCGKPHHPYAVYNQCRTGLYGVAVANYDEKETIVVEVHLENDQELSHYRLVDDPGWKETRNGITIPPLSAAVLLP